MKCVYSRRRRRGLGCAGVATLEFALVGLAFFLILFAAMDLGRYFLTVHSLRTLTSEMARATLVTCAPQTAAQLSSTCSLSTSAVTNAEATVPFLVSAHFVTTPTGSRTTVSSSGLATITASAMYNFTFVLPLFSTLDGPISSSTTLQTYY